MCLFTSCLPVCGVSDMCLELCCMLFVVFLINVNVQIELEDNAKWKCVCFYIPASEIIIHKSFAVGK